MREHRIFTGQPLDIGHQVALEEGPRRHLLQVLRLKAGAEVTLFNGDGYDYAARISRADRRSAVIEITGRGEQETAATFSITLGIAISKGERMDFAVQKSVELGVTAITPLITERCVVRLDQARMGKRLHHWRQVLIAACEQSGRRRVPELNETLELGKWLSIETAEQGLLLDHRSEYAMRDLPRPERGIRLLVGPEGGLSASERDLALKHRFTGVRLGPRVLRTETAPLAAIAAIQTLWGDFR